MSKTYLNYPFDDDLFFDSWQSEPDTVKTALINSGVIVEDEDIKKKIATGGNLYTIPFYNILDGDDVNYNGQTDITTDETTADSQQGVVYGRAKGFTSRDFVAELTGSDPMGHIASSVAGYWQKKRQKRLIGILGGIFGITGDADWAKHTVDLSVKEGTPYKVEANTLSDVAADVLGDNQNAFSTAIMHSAVAKTFKNLQLLDYWTQTDKNGIQRPMALANVNGFLAVIDDGVPVDLSTPGFPKYTTYLLGTGCIRTAPGRVDKPVGTDRDEAKNGGQDTLYTRLRETIHPNGFSFVVPSSGFTESPTDAQLFAKSNWKRKFNAKAIPMAQIITNG
ncbi:MAG: coat protein [Eubacterium sp.]